VDDDAGDALERLGGLAPDAPHDPFDGVGRLCGPVASGRCHGAEPTLGPVRRTLGLLVAAAAAALTALILGEYELTLGTATAAGLVVGLGLPEIVLGVARWRGPVPAVLGAAMAGGSILWAGWISSGRGVAPFR